MKNISIMAAGLSLTLALGSTAHSAESPDDLVIVANKSVNLTQADLDTVRDIFLKKRGTWPNGQEAVPVNASEGSDLRAAFLRKVLAMSPGEEQSYWQKEQLTGGKMKPADFPTPLKAVFKVKGSVGYVFRKDLKADLVNTILVLPAGQ